MSRKLDAAIAEALGRDNYAKIRWDGNEVYLPHYSTDGNAMLELDREMRERGWRLSVVFNYEGYYVYYDNPEKGMKVSDKHELLTKAVALAAYKSLKGKEWTEE